MAGGDGHLYELLYEPEDHWFRSKMRKKNCNQSFWDYLVPNFTRCFLPGSRKKDVCPLVDICFLPEKNMLFTLDASSVISVCLFPFSNLNSGRMFIRSGWERYKYFSKKKKENYLMDQDFDKDGLLFSLVQWKTFRVQFFKRNLLRHFHLSTRARHPDRARWTLSPRWSIWFSFYIDVFTLLLSRCLLLLLYIFWCFGADSRLFLMFMCSKRLFRLEMMDHSSSRGIRFFVVADIK